MGERLIAQRVEHKLRGDSAAAWLSRLTAVGSSGYDERMTGLSPPAHPFPCGLACGLEYGLGLWGLGWGLGLWGLGCGFRCGLACGLACGLGCGLA